MSAFAGSEARRRSRILRIDVRTVLISVLLVSIATFLVSNRIAHLVLTVGLAAMTIVVSGWRVPAAAVGGSLVCFAGLTVSQRFGLVFPPPTTLLLIANTIPMIIVVRVLFDMPSSKLTSGLRATGLPERLQTVLVVVLRFVPTVAREARAVAEAMRTRGLLRRPLAHPLSVLEHAIVPLIFRELRVADELSASAILRGIEAPGRRHGYYVNRFGVVDAAVLIALLTLIAVCLAGSAVIGV